MAPRIRKHDSPSGRPCMCDTFDKVYCPDCELTLHEENEDQLLQHLEDRDRELETPLCGNLPCAFCEVPFSRRAALIQHYESGPCRPLLVRLKSLLERLITLPFTESLDIHRLWASSITEVEYSVLPPAIATQRSWNARSNRYKCHLCITDHLGFMALETLNLHLASGRHAANRYQCPYHGCRLRFCTLPGLVQHIEMRKCQCMRSYNWFAFYVLDSYGDNRVPQAPSRFDGDTAQLYYTRGRALRLVSTWMSARESRVSECFAWGGRAWEVVRDQPLVFHCRHEMVYILAVALGFGLVCAVYFCWVR